MYSPAGVGCAGRDDGFSGFAKHPIHTTTISGKAASIPIQGIEQWQTSNRGVVIATATAKK